MTKDIQPAVAQFSWLDTDRMTRALVAKISADQYEPDIIVGILRGGCIPAVHLAHLLNVRSFYALHLQTTVSDEVRADRQYPRVVSHTSLDYLRGKRILLVDDVTNTGLTLSVAKEFLEKHAPTSIRSCVLVWDTVPPPSMDAVSNIEADYYIETVHAWVIFPWNV